MAQSYIDALDQAAEQVRAGDVLKAYLAWQRYPSEAAFIAGQPSDPENPGLRMLAENRLYRLLRESVALLMKTGEELGIDPTPICESARVCERVCHDFRQWRDPCADTDLWPGCLGSNVYRLPDQERHWVQQSDATLRRLLAAWQQRTSGKQPEAHDRLDPAVPYSPNQLAKAFGVPIEALRKALERFRKGSLDGWVEIPNPKPRQARFLYYPPAVQPLIDGLKSSGQCPAKRNTP